MLPTIAKLIGAKLPEQIDGLDISDVICGNW